jgi:hypothetical protein
MKSKRRVIFWIAIILVIALSAPALILANFSAMSSQIVHDSTLATSTGSAQPGVPIHSAKTGLVVKGDSRLAWALQNQIITHLQNYPAFGQLQLLDRMDEQANDPILLLEIAPQDIFWTPIYARANLRVNVSYASDGDISFRLSQPVEFKHTSDQTVVKKSGSYTFTDTSWGLISNPGYLDYLAREIARPIAADLKGFSK